MDAFDLPLVQTLEYFGGVMAQGYKWAAFYGNLFGLIGLAWSGFKVAMSRMTVKDFWWDTIFKWVGYLLLLNLYPAIVIGIGGIAGEIGIKAGGAKDAIVSELKAMRSSIEADLATVNSIEAGNDEDAKSRLDEHSPQSLGNKDSYNDFVEKASGAIPGLKGGNRWDSNEMNRKLSEQRHDKSDDENKKFKSLFQAETFKAINAILGDRNLDGTKIGDNTDTYISLDIFIKDADGNETFYLSPGALIRMTLLAANIMHSKNTSAFIQRNEEIDAAKLNPFVSAGRTIQSGMQFVLDGIVVWFCVIVLALCVIFALVQYIMTVIEFTIVAAVGVIFIPLLLFDGTKDIPKKLVPVFISFMVKMIVITLCLMFVYYLIIEFTINTITSDGFDIVWLLVDVAFNAVLSYVMTQNAPKIAQTILTGQPQLSMGEFVAAAGTAAATAGGMKAASANAVRGAVNTGTNIAGEAGKINSARKNAARQVARLGGNRKQGNMAAFKAMGAVATSDLKDRVKSGFEKFSKGHDSIPGWDKVKQMAGLGGGGHGASGGSGGGANAHGISGQGSQSGHAGEILGTSSNSNFKTATKFDERTGSQRNMTHKEFMDEKNKQGKMAGDNAALKVMIAAEEERNQQQNAKNSGSSELGDKVTDGVRANK
ncbi:MAG: type IV secretion system protein [Spirochaetia bacterium]|nr:type IV secretion system protein [Spirochaetia bacterium]